jgi:hypothetical protein
VAAKNRIARVLQLIFDVRETRRSELTEAPPQRLAERLEARE